MKTTMVDEVAQLVVALIEGGIPPDGVGAQLLIGAHAAFVIAGGDEHAVRKFEDAVAKLRRHQAAPIVQH